MPPTQARPRHRRPKVNNYVPEVWPAALKFKDHFDYQLYQTKLQFVTEIENLIMITPSYTTSAEKWSVVQQVYRGRHDLSVQRPNDSFSSSFYSAKQVMKRLIELSNSLAAQQVTGYVDENGFDLGYDTDDYAEEAIYSGFCIC